MYVMFRKKWILNKTGMTPPILLGNIPSCIFGKILFIALVCVLVYFQFKLVFCIKGCGEIDCQFPQHDDAKNLKTSYLL
jgi:hypothetical protein